MALASPRGRDSVWDKKNDHRRSLMTLHCHCDVRYTDIIDINTDICDVHLLANYMKFKQKDPRPVCCPSFRSSASGGAPPAA